MEKKNARTQIVTETKFIRLPGQIVNLQDGTGIFTTEGQIMQ